MFSNFSCRILLYFPIRVSKGRYLDGGFQLGLGNLKGLGGVISLFLKKCLRRSDLLRLVYS